MHQDFDIVFWFWIVLNAIYLLWTNSLIVLVPLVLTAKKPFSFNDVSILFKWAFASHWKNFKIYIGTY